MSAPSVMSNILEVGLSWDLVDKKKQIDLDLSCVFVNGYGKVLDAVYFNQKTSADGSVYHYNDSRDGSEGGDDELLVLDLTKVHPDVQFLVITTSCYTKHNFSEVKSGRVEVRNYDNKAVILPVELEKCGNSTSIVICAIYRNQATWNTQAIYQPCEGRTFQDLKEIIRERLTSAHLIDPGLMSEFQIDIKNERAFDVNKGDVVNLDSLKRVMLGLGWDPKYSERCDVDSSCVLMDHEQVHETIYYGHKSSREMSVVHKGDNLTGEGAGDDEQICVELDKVPSNVTSLIFTVTIYTSQTFEKVEKLFVRMVDSNSNKELFKYKVKHEKKMNGHNAMLVCKVFKTNGQWKFMALGKPKNGRNVNDLTKDGGLKKYAKESYVPKSRKSADSNSHKHKSEEHHKKKHLFF